MLFVIAPHTSFIPQILILGNRDFQGSKVFTLMNRHLHPACFFRLQKTAGPPLNVSGDDQTYDSAIWIDDDQIEELERLVAEMRDDYNRSIEPTELGQMRCGYYHGPNYPH